MDDVTSSNLFLTLLTLLSILAGTKCFGNFSWLRKFALGLLKNEASFKASIRCEQRKVCTNVSYLSKVIGQI